MHPRLSNIEHRGDANHPLGIAVVSAVPRDHADADRDQPTPHH
jgi:hypothetical protein